MEIQGIGLWGSKEKTREAIGKGLNPSRSQVDKTKCPYAYLECNPFGILSPLSCGVSDGL